MEKMKILVEHNNTQFDVMFNPEEYTLNKDNNFSTQNVPGLSSPLLQFVHGNLRTLDMELYFDTYEERVDVRTKTDDVAKLLEIDPELHAPPILQLSWATLQLRCVLARLSQKFTMFLDDGQPVRARLTVTFNEFIDPEREASQIRRQTADFSKEHQVVDGETVSGLAAHYYEDSRLWRPIAIVNDLNDPRGLRGGQLLQIPSLPFTDRLTGEVIR